MNFKKCICILQCILFLNLNLFCFDNYKIGVDDELEVLVSESNTRNYIEKFKNNDTLKIFGGRFYNSNIVKVTSDGSIHLPLLGDIIVKDKSLYETEKKLKSLYGEYFVEPDIYLKLVNSFSRYIYIIGEVRNPGKYYISKSVDPLEAIALAGGPTNLSKLKKVRFIRRGQKTKIINIDKLRKNNNTGDLFLQPYDVIDVPKKFKIDLQDLFFIFSIVGIGAAISD